MSNHKLAQAPHIIPHLRRQRRLLAEPGHELAQARVAPLHQLRHIDPLRIALHLQRLVEAKRLCVEVKAEPGEGGRMAIEKLGRLPAYHAVE